MIAILGVFSAAALLALIVYALHKFQQKEKEESVDRSSPLPPLPLPPMLDHWPPDRVQVNEGQDWQVVAKELKDSGQIRQALEVCSSAYPQMGAFRQASILLRSEVRESKRMGNSPDESLAELYRISALATLFHEKTSDSPVLSASVLKKIRYSDFGELYMPYNELGFNHLKLLTATDLKMMTERWGVPASHRHVREFHRVAWQQILLSLK